MGLNSVSGSSVKSPCGEDIANEVEVDKTVEGADNCLAGVLDVLDPVIVGRSGVGGPYIGPCVWALDRGGEGVSSSSLVGLRTEAGVRTVDEAMDPGVLLAAAAAAAAEAEDTVVET